MAGGHFVLETYELFFYFQINSHTSQEELEEV